MITDHSTTVVPNSGAFIVSNPNIKTVKNLQNLESHKAVPTGILSEGDLPQKEECQLYDKDNQPRIPRVTSPAPLQ